MGLIYNFIGGLLAGIVMTMVLTFFIFILYIAIYAVFAFIKYGICRLYSVIIKKLR